MPLIDLAEIATWTAEDHQRVQRETPEYYAAVHEALTTGWLQNRQEVALAHYRPLNPDAWAVHTSTAHELAIVGGNRSGKSETMLSELAIALTGHIPVALQGRYPTEKLRGRLPCRARLVCNSMTRTLDPVIKPKLRWDCWEGAEPETGLGHWGWIPRRCLVGGTWEKAYSAKTDTLKVAVDSLWVGANGDRCEMRGFSSLQFMSYNQDTSDFAGSSLHLVCHDELPPERIYRENRLRTLDVKGRILTAFTPPDEVEPGNTVISGSDVAWFYDQVYERGLPGPDRDPRYETVTLWTEKNPINTKDEIAAMVRGWTDAQREARLYGRFLHLSGVVYPLFAPYPAQWCFTCSKKIVAGVPSCPTCGGNNVEAFSHVIAPFDVPKEWPVVHVIDPHPRKADANGWFALTPSDGVVMIGELEATGDVNERVGAVHQWEDRAHCTPALRLMDPNIATEGNDLLERGWTHRMAYDRAGLRCDLANDSISLGIQHVNELLRPDPFTRRPRFEALRTCTKFIYGMSHWSWDEYKGGDREPKEKVRDRWKDYPDLLRYFSNGMLSYRGLKRGAATIRLGTPRGGY